IFPGKLAQSISFETPEEAWELARYYAQHPKQKEQIRQAWQKLILQEHSYSQRLQTILHHLGCGKR
ncbi:MAG: glycosyltransferase family 1 protein, partial [Desulfovibrionales bacterium]|nr:glycosyltransferase family 1 protein [Desulfovibrionales bacterium]